MHTRGVSKRMAKEREMEEEIEIVMDSEMEQQIGCLLYTSRCV